jgi:hypothetical protein
MKKFKLTKASELNEKENHFKLMENVRKKVMPIREDHPFLEISGLTFNNEHIFEIGIRPTLKVNGTPMFEIFEQVRCIGVLPDFKMALGHNIHPSIMTACHDHMMGTTVNQFIKRLNWRNTANIENLILFPKQADGTLSDEIDFNRLQLFFELLLGQFVMLDCSTQQPDDDRFMLFIHSRGEWTTFEDEPLPKLRGIGVEFSKERLKTEFNRFLPELKSGTLANDAVKAQIISVLSSQLYAMSFDGAVEADLLAGPHRKLNIIKEPVTLADLLKQKVAEKGLVGPGGEKL